MRIEEFAGKVLKEVKDKANGELNVQVTKALKNNGVKLVGISVSGPGTNAGPCIYLDGYYEGYKDGKVEISEAAENVYRKITEHLDDFSGISLADFCQWETVRNNIYAKLVNAEMNKKLLADVPHRKLLDLAVVYYAKVEGISGDEGTASILIHNSHMQMWQEEEGGLYRESLRNMRKDGEPSFEDMGTVIRGMVAGKTGRAGNVPSPSGGMYVLTNRHKLFGAAELLDGNTLKEIGDRLGGDFVVLPSSIHEAIIIPADSALPYMTLAAMVHEINETQVDIEERLSDHVYVYGREEGILKIAA